MATNYTLYRGKPVERINIANLNVGDRLVHAIWGSSPAIWKEEVWTVTKILKSRLVLERRVRRGDEIVTDTLRMLVQNSTTYPKNNGELLARREGQPDSSWSHEIYYFFTPDDPVLAELYDKYAPLAVTERKRANARLAAKTIVENPRKFTVHDAERAIQALTAFIENEQSQLTDRLSNAYTRTNKEREEHNA